MAQEIFEKWGFGMAPPKPLVQKQRIAACQRLLSTLKSPDLPPPELELLEAFSLVKGMFNRIARRDQWDWFTVQAQLGHPSGNLAEAIAGEISSLREAVRDKDVVRFGEASNKACKLPTRACLRVFCQEIVIRDEPDGGWIYILSTREYANLLKIGMTTRTVEERVREINSATGVAIPFGVRRCWRVRCPRKAEAIIHMALGDFRLRNDREFFRAEFHIVGPVADRAIADSGLEIRSLRAFASLNSD